MVRIGIQNGKHGERENKTEYNIIIYKFRDRSFKNLRGLLSHLFSSDK
jgi:hypothetical protein